MAGYKHKMIQLTSKIVSTIPHIVLQKVANQKIISPFYHTISDNDLPHIKHLYHVKNVQDFKKDLDFLLKHYQPIDYFQFIDFYRNKTSPKKPSFLLTFDDGLRELHDVIAPILLAKGIPAIFFLNSAFIDNNDLFFRFKASLLIEELQKYPEKLNAINHFFKQPLCYKSELLQIQFHDRHILDEIATILSFSFNDYLKQNQPYLISDEIVNLKEKGFVIGAHSVTHPEYQYLDLENQIQQTKESVAFICDTFSLDYKIFSFPFTDHNVTKTFFETINSNKIVDCTFGCAGQKVDVVSNNFQRFALENGNKTAKELLQVELFYYLIKKMLHKNIVLRND